MRVLALVAGLSLAVVMPAFATELVVNGNFDAGTTGWTYDRAIWGAGFPDFFGAPDTGPGAEGVHNAGTSPLGDPVLRKSVGNSMAGSFWVYQVITDLTVGETYTLSGMYAGGVGQFADFDGSAWWEIGMFPGGYDAGTVDGPDPSYVAAKTEIGATPGESFGWTSFGKDFVATDPTQTVYLKWGVWTEQWDYNYFGAYFDGISVVPEPAALVLMLVGAPLLLRRRQRA